MTANVTQIVGAIEKDIYLGNYTYSDIVASMDRLRAKLDTGGTDAIFYKTAAFDLKKIMRDASAGTNHPTERILFTDAAGAANSDSGLTYASGRMGVGGDPSAVAGELLRVTRAGTCISVVDGNSAGSAVVAHRVDAFDVDGSSNPATIQLIARTNASLASTAAGYLGIARKNALLLTMNSTNNSPCAVGTVSESDLVLSTFDEKRATLEADGTNLLLRMDSDNDTFTTPGTLALKNVSGDPEYSLHSNDGARRGRIYLSGNNLVIDSAVQNLDLVAVNRTVAKSNFELQKLKLLTSLVTTSYGAGDGSSGSPFWVDITDKNIANFGGGGNYWLIGPTVTSVEGQVVHFCIKADTYFNSVYYSAAKLIIGTYTDGNWYFDA